MPPTQLMADGGRFCGKREGREEKSEQRSLSGEATGVVMILTLTFNSLISAIHSFTKLFSFPRTASLKRKGAKFGPEVKPGAGAAVRSSRGTKERRRLTCG